MRTYSKSAVFGKSKEAALARDSQYFNKSGGGSGISASMNGYVWDQINNVNHTYGGYFSTRVNEGQAKKIVNSVTLTAYGAIGKNGIGKVFSNTISDSGENTNYLYSDISEGYTAVAVVYTSKHANWTIWNIYDCYLLKLNNEGR
ncbi:TPA: hypothetical protein ACGW7M_004310 [Bacillus albus]